VVSAWRLCVETLSDFQGTTITKPAQQGLPDNQSFFVDTDLIVEIRQHSGTDFHHSLG
jgi:hypothetical protein